MRANLRLVYRDRATGFSLQAPPASSSSSSTLSGFGGFQPLPQPHLVASVLLLLLLLSLLLPPLLLLSIMMLVREPMRMHSLWMSPRR